MYGELLEVKTEVQSNGEKIQQVSTKMRSHFKQLEKKIDQHHDAFQIVSNELKSVRIDIEYLTGKTGKHEMEIYHLKKQLQT